MAKFILKITVLKWEKNAARTDQEDLSLEGILQCEENEKLKALEEILK